ncbi:hypothetical protein SDC9_161287 [bioreactor metagenome]|uniref:Uncharacterized protein n=1 Tax=bioreactor metagenome TaxID=1076179 RepID=A0A645FHV0_9ZZZZ
MAVIARKKVAKRRDGQKIQHRNKIAGIGCNRGFSPNRRAEKRHANGGKRNGWQRRKDELLRVAWHNCLFTDELEHIRQWLIPRRPFAVLHPRIDFSIHELQHKRVYAQKQKPGEDEHLKNRKQHALFPSS